MTDQSKIGKFKLLTPFPTKKTKNKVLVGKDYLLKKNTHDAPLTPQTPLLTPPTGGSGVKGGQGGKGGWGRIKTEETNLPPFPLSATTQVRETNLRFVKGQTLNLKKVSFDFNSKFSKIKNSLSFNTKSVKNQIWFLEEMKKKEFSLSNYSVFHPAKNFDKEQQFKLLPSKTGKILSNQKLQDLKRFVINLKTFKFKSFKTNPNCPPLPCEAKPPVPIYKEGKEGIKPEGVENPKEGQGRINNKRLQKDVKISLNLNLRLKKERRETTFEIPDFKRFVSDIGGKDFEKLFTNQRIENLINRKFKIQGKNSLISFINVDDLPDLDDFNFLRHPPFCPPVLTPPTYPPYGGVRKLGVVLPPLPPFRGVRGDGVYTTLLCKGEKISAWEAKISTPRSYISRGIREVREESKKQSFLFLRKKLPLSASSSPHLSSSASSSSLQISDFFNFPEGGKQKRVRREICKKNNIINPTNFCPLNKKFKKTEFLTTQTLLTTQFLEKAINNIKPNLEVRKVRRGGTTYQVPTILRDKRSEKLGIGWLIESAQKNKKKFKLSFSESLANELVGAFHKSGEARQKRNQLLQLAESNRAYIRYRWW